MKKHSFLSDAKPTSLFIGKLILIITTMLLGTGFVKAQAFDLQVYWLIRNPPPVVLGGQDIWYQVLVKNNSKLKATGVSLTIILPRA